MTNCIETTWGCLQKDGYGRKMIEGRVYMAHRVAWAEANGVDFTTMTPDMIIRHTCDNPPCINPEHLVLGTHKDNAQDRVERGRNGVNQYALADTCINGHMFTPENTRHYRYPSGKSQRFCITCHKERGRRYRA